MGPINVAFREGERVTKRVVDVRLSSKVQDGVNFFLTQDIAHKVWGCDITFDKLKVGFIHHFLQVLETSTIVELVVNDDFVLWVLGAQQNGHVRCNKAYKNEVAVELVQMNGNMVPQSTSIISNSEPLGNYSCICIGEPGQPTITTNEAKTSTCRL